MIGYDPIEGSVLAESESEAELFAIREYRHRNGYYSNYDTDDELLDFYGPCIDISMSDQIAEMSKIDLELQEWENGF